MKKKEKNLENKEEREINDEKNEERKLIESNEFVVKKEERK